MAETTTCVSAAAKATLSHCSIAASDRRLFVRAVALQLIVLRPLAHTVIVDVSSLNERERDQEP